MTTTEPTSLNLCWPEVELPESVVDVLTPGPLRQLSGWTIRAGQHVRLVLSGEHTREAVYLGALEPMDGPLTQVFRLSGGELIHHSIARAWPDGTPTQLRVDDEVVGIVYGEWNKQRFHRFGKTWVTMRMFSELCRDAIAGLSARETVDGIRLRTLPPDVPLSTLCQSTSPWDGE